MGDLRPSFPVRQPSIWRAVDGLAPVAAAEQNARSLCSGDSRSELGRSGAWPPTRRRPWRNRLVAI